jgi:Na+/H+-dicarboxylate symporter
MPWLACFQQYRPLRLDLLQALAWYVVTVLLGLSLHMFGVYSLSIYFPQGCRRWSFSSA